MKTPSRLLVAGLVACAIPVFASAATGEELWKKNCAMCHGQDGTGQTMMGKKLGLKDYTDPAVQATFSDEEIATAIKEGMKNEAGKKLMPSFAAKIAEEDIPGLVAYVRSLQHQPAS